MKYLIVGGGGREASFALDLASDERNTVCAVTPHENPLIAECVKKSSGTYRIANPSDPEIVSKFAASITADYAFVSADEPLANGVVDVLLECGIKAVGGKKDAARIEWDKIYSIEMTDRLCPENTPFYRVARDTDSIRDAVSEFESRGMQVVVKPQGLTGGKGVKVMPEHLRTYGDCIRYAESLLGDGSGAGAQVLFVEKMSGIEFTVMGMTDGRHLAISPATYDYPYRYKGDTGPGTGGMGCFADSDQKLPFMTDDDVYVCRTIMQKVIDDMHDKSLGFTGVLNGGFFKTSQGIRFMEFNSRFGDPECLNIMSVLKTPLADIIHKMWEGSISDGAVSFARRASVNKYMVAKEYPNASKDAIDFSVDNDALKESGITAYYASCISTGKDEYRTLKKSRVLALSAVSDSIHDASDAINDAIKDHVRGNLEYRTDIGSRDNLQGIIRAASNLAQP